MDMEDAFETPTTQCIYLLLQGRGQTPYLKTIEKYWDNAPIVEYDQLKTDISQSSVWTRSS